MAIVPGSYEEWKHCITVSCGIPLTADYVAGRIAALNDPADHHTQSFIKRWGEDHHRRTVAWFEQSAKELQA